MITSVQNPQIKALAKLHHPKGRHETGLILIEGRHGVAEALQANVAIETLYIREDIGADPSWGAFSPIAVSQSVMAKISTTDSPPPIIAVAHRPNHSFRSVLQRPNFLLLGISGIQDPGNLGTLVRSACAFGVDALILLDNSLDAYQPKVIRASAGLVFQIPMIEDLTWETLQPQWAQIAQGQLWGTNIRQGQPYFKAEYGPRTMILLGGEAQGLPAEIQQATQPLHIPMAPNAESLNVAIAGAIILADHYHRAKNQ